MLHEAWKGAKAVLRRGIKKTRLQSWKDLISEVDKDPWGLPFKIVTKRLVTRRNEIFKEVIGVYPEILLEVFNSFLQEGRFFVDWKKQRLVLLRKGNKPLGFASSYRPICLLDTMGKLLEELILQRLPALLVGENGLSENQFGFRKGRSTVDAIQAVLNIAINARKGTGKRKGFCALISIDIRNAFNTARCNICIEVMMRKKVPD